MYTGSVVWFHGGKGYGFISRNDGGDDVFVHFSSVVMEGYRNLKEGQKVTFEIENGPQNKPQATNVHIIR